MRTKRADIFKTFSDTENYPHTELAEIRQSCHLITLSLHLGADIFSTPTDFCAGGDFIRLPQTNK